MGVSLPPMMLIPRPLESFFNSIDPSSFLAGDFPGDFAGVLAGDFASFLVSAAFGANVFSVVLAAAGATSLAGPAAVVGFLSASAAAAGAASGAVASGLGAFLASSSSLGLTTRTRTMPVTCFRIKAAYFRKSKGHQKKSCQVKYCNTK